MRIASSKFRRFFVVAMILALAITMVACNYNPATNPPTGGNNDQNGTNQGNNNQGSANQGGNTSVDEDVFTVRFSESIPYAYLVGIQVMWTDLESINGAFYSAYFDKDGVATVTGLDGDYRVTLSDVPEGYTYNPNIYYVDNTSRDVTIKLYKLSVPDNESTASGLNAYDSFSLTSTGAYRAVLTEENFENGLWFTYQPTAKGTYSFESMIDITENKLNPMLDVHSGTFAFVNPTPTEDSPIDTGGEASTYTKNFRWEVQLKSIGNVYHFRLYAESLDKGVFPLNVDFILDKDGELTNSSSSETIVVEAEHNFEAIQDIAFKDMKGSQTYYCYFDGNNGVLDGSKVFYNEDLDYYYVKDSSGNEKTLYAAITIGTVVTDQGFENLNSPRKIEGKDENNQTHIYNYVNFIETYKKHCQGGCYPVTKELQLFLQRYSTSKLLFKDGGGLAEDILMSTGENQWLFGCIVFV